MSVAVLTKKKREINELVPAATTTVPERKIVGGSTTDPDVPCLVHLYVTGCSLPFQIQVQSKKKKKKFRNPWRHHFLLLLDK